MLDQSQIGRCRCVTFGADALAFCRHIHHLLKFFGAVQLDAVPTLGFGHFQHIVDGLGVGFGGGNGFALVFKQHGGAVLCGEILAVCDDIAAFDAVGRDFIV